MKRVDHRTEGNFCVFRNAFTDLMTSGTLTSQSHISIPTSSQSFPAIIQNICQNYRLTG